MPPDTEKYPNKKQTFRRRLDKWLLAVRQTPQVIQMAWRAWPVGTIIVPILTITAGLLPAISLYFLKKVIDGLILWTGGNPEAGRQMVFLFLSLEIVSLLLRHGFDFLIQFVQTVLESRLRFCIQDRIMNRAIDLDMSFFETPAFYDKLQRAQREVGFRPFSIIISMVQGAREAITLIGYLAVIVILAWWLVPYLLVASLPALIVQARFGWEGWMIASGRTPKERQMSYLQRLLTSDRDIKEIRLFGLGEYLAKRWKDLFWEFYRQDVQLARRRRLAEFGAVVLETLAYAGFYAYAIYCTVTRPAVTIGSLVMYTQAMERATGSVGLIMKSIANFYENSLYLSNLFEYLAQKPTLTAPAVPKPVPLPIRKGICFEEVTFRYPGASVDTLKDISFEIPGGCRVALVGENGAGKTTLIKLLARLYDPQHGRITVDGIDLKKLDPVEWQQNLGIIFQDFSRYYLTARENVGFGDLAHLDDLSRLNAAAKLSGALESIERLGKKWETTLGKMFDEGHELSLGEWQKVALARAFFRESPILVLDEPTASLDAKQEYEIFRQFHDLTCGKTTVLISHRFSSVRMAERIFVIEDGRLVEQGGHEELLSLNNRYAELFNRQAAAYR
ncbi:MAG: ABC transporter ATP-binding protein [Planctomycetota bacterium]|nr:ABC transporter ATP-binding protein [Planctomycetota bacterium]